MLNKAVAMALGALLLSVPAGAATGDRVDAIMYKNPGCECCDGHAEALRRAGFDVTVVPTPDLAAVKARAGVPAALQGCHTILVGGYAVEGHVPVAAVQRLLAERPAVQGIALPGMPAGSPGMGGVKTAPFRVLSFGAQGTRLYAVE